MNRQLNIAGKKLLGCNEFFVLFLIGMSLLFGNALIHADDGIQANDGTQPEVLKLLLKETPQPKYGQTVSQKITGRVLLKTDSGSDGVPDVSVTDGYSVVRTNARGEYSIRPSRDAVFIYITRPSGYDIRGDWYKPLSANVDFEIAPAEQDENEYIFVHVTDTHVSSNPRSLQGLSQFVREVNQLEPRPRFVLNSGDLLDLSKSLVSSPETGRTAFRNYVGIMNHLTMPHYNVAGDHTDSSYRLNEFPRGDHRCGKPLYWEFLGPHFFSFEYGKIHFMSIDYGYHLGTSQRVVNGRTLEYPIYQVQPMHTQWMQEDMLSRSQGSFVVTSSEYDLGEHCPGFLEMAKNHDVRFQLVGDHHVTAEKSRPVPYRVGGALAGCWWNTKTKQLCPDLSPQGYSVYRVVGEEMEHFYKGLGQRVSITSHRVGAVLSGHLDIVAHLVQPQVGEALEYSVDGQVWNSMTNVGQPFYRTRYSARIDSKSLPDGLMTLHVRSTATGETRTRMCVVDNDKDMMRLTESALLSFKVGAEAQMTQSKSPTGKVDVLFNGHVIGELQPSVSKTYSFTIEASRLEKVNRLSFRFAETTDGMSLGAPILTFDGQEIRDPRDAAIRDVRIAPWGANADSWGCFIVGDAAPPDETPFCHQQNEFCFVLKDSDE